MFQKKRMLAGALALATCVNLVTVGAFAGNGRSITSTQTSSEEETVYVNSLGGDSREVNFNDHWKFNLGDGSADKNYTDASWDEVDLPHDYSIEQEFTTSGEGESGYLPGGTGWYRKSFTEVDGNDLVLPAFIRSEALAAPAGTARASLRMKAGRTRSLPSTSAACT